MVWLVEAGVRLLIAVSKTLRPVTKVLIGVQCINGSPKEQLLPYAESWGADLMVMGNSAKNLLLRRLFGETALDVIRNANLPLFLAQ